MLYSVIYYTGLDHAGLQNLRKEHDPYAHLANDHITLVFPVPDEIGLDSLVSHVRRIAGNRKSFDVRITGLEKSWDHWLFLKIAEGNEKIIELHDDLYTGPLAGYLRKDIPYVPHIGIGLFVTEDYDPLHPRMVPCDEARYDIARAEADRLGMDWRRTVDGVTVVGINEELTHLEDIATIAFDA
jgi:2'-5' RNA ligase